MSLTKLTADLNIIQALDDEPNDVGGLTAAQLKAKFDQAGGAIKTYLNGTLTPELDTALAGKVGTEITVNGHALSGNVTVTKGDIGLGNVDNTSDANKPVSTAQQAALDAKADKSNVLEKDGTAPFTPTADYQPATKKYVDDTAAGVALGQLPDNSVTEAKLTQSLRGKINGALQTSGGTVSGNLTVAGSLIIGSPSGNSDAVPKSYADNIVPVGSILMWSGAADNIPNKWALCDGENGTPDLRGRFLVGAGGAYEVGATGGLESVTLTTSQIPSHSHSVTGRAGSEGGANAGPANGASNTASMTFQTNNTGGGKSHENRPPYYALCYIMYLGSN